jgi:flagellin FlaB
MFAQSIKFANRIRNEEIGSPVVKSTVRFLKRIGAEEAGITALETAIILIAFVVVASVFAFTMLSAGTFSTERGKEAIYAGITEVQSSMELKGSVVATKDATESKIISVTFTLANVLNGEPVNFDSGTNAVLVFEYRDADNRIAIASTSWEVTFLGNNNANDLLENGEMAEVTVAIPTAVTLGPNTQFVIEIKPPSGSVLSLQRTTPAYLDMVNDLN